MHNSVFDCTELVFKAKQIRGNYIVKLLLPEFHAFSSPGVA